MDRTCQRPCATDVHLPQALPCRRCARGHSWEPCGCGTSAAGGRPALGPRDRWAVDPACRELGIGARADATSAGRRPGRRGHVAVILLGDGPLLRPASASRPKKNRRNSCCPAPFERGPFAWAVEFQGRLRWMAPEGDDRPDRCGLLTQNGG